MKAASQETWGQGRQRCRDSRGSDQGDFGHMPQATRRASETRGDGLFRACDVLIAGVAFLVSLPAIVVAAVGIKLSSKGPVFYRAQRVGRGGRVFTMFKLRTMHEDKEQDPVISTDGDSRAFPFGELLRVLKADDLPQFFNVLRGDMSMVGIRPEDPTIVKRYYAEQHYRIQKRLPGITGLGSLFQYAHLRDLVTVEDPERSYARNLMPTKVALELLYADNRSLGYYLRVLGRTVLWMTRRGLGMALTYPRAELDRVRPTVVPAIGIPYGTANTRAAGVRGVAEAVAEPELVRVSD